MGSVLASAREPMVTPIRLAWWREALERLDRAPPPAEPMLEAVAHYLLPAGLAGAELAAMEEGWAAIASPGRLPPDALDLYARQRGGLLFRLSARLLGGERDGLEVAGERWALTDLARRSLDPADRAAAVAAARARPGEAPWPKPLRPLGMLAILADRDVARGFEPQGSPTRMFRMLRHRLTGR